MYKEHTKAVIMRGEKQIHPSYTSFCFFFFSLDLFPLQKVTWIHRRVICCYRCNQKQRAGHIGLLCLFLSSCTSSYLHYCHGLRSAMINIATILASCCTGEKATTSFPHATNTPTTATTSTRTTCYLLFCFILSLQRTFYSTCLFLFLWFISTRATFSLSFVSTFAFSSPRPRE